VRNVETARAAFTEHIQRLLVQPLDVHVSVAEPGFFRTDFLDASPARFAGNPIGDCDARSCAMG